jgi:hypothetical protein
MMCLNLLNLISWRRVMVRGKRGVHRSDSVRNNSQGGGKSSRLMPRGSVLTLIHLPCHHDLPPYKADESEYNRALLPRFFDPAYSSSCPSKHHQPILARTPSSTPRSMPSRLNIAARLFWPMVGHTSPTLRKRRHWLERSINTSCPCSGSCMS